MVHTAAARERKRASRRAVRDVFGGCVMQNIEHGFFYTLALNLLANKKPKQTGSRARLQQTSNRLAMNERLRLQAQAAKHEMCVCHAVKEEVA